MGVTYLKRGMDSAKAVEEYEAEVKHRQDQRGLLWRFYLDDGASARITFVDGDLTPQGVLDFVSTREHQLYMAGKYTNWFVCTEMSDPPEPCPICEMNDNASLIGAFTIIDHRVSHSKDKTKTYQDQPRLFVAKKDTIKVLQKEAVLRQGLAGCTFEVSRSGEKSPNVGSNFSFIEKRPIAVLQKMFTKVIEDPKTKEKKEIKLFVPVNYERELPLVSAADLRKQGFGKVGGKIGGEAPLTMPTGATSTSQQVADTL